MLGPDPVGSDGASRGGDAAVADVDDGINTPGGAVWPAVPGVTGLSPPRYVTGSRWPMRPS